MRKAWKTPFTQTFPCRLPLCSAPMAGVSGGLLASRVCRAGGLGFIAAGHFRDLPALETEIAIFFQDGRRQLQGGLVDVASDHNVRTVKGVDAAINKLSIGFIGHSSLSTEEGWENYEYILRKYQPLAVQFFAPSIVHRPSRGTNVTLAKKYGTKFIAQVGSIREAKEAMQHDIDAIICQGSEAGGHGLRRNLGNSTMALTSQVYRMIRESGKHKSDEKTVIPVLAAGGIVSGKHLASALCLCDGAVLGTRFWASEESLGNTALQQTLVRSNSCDDVVRTTVFD